MSDAPKAAHSCASFLSREQHRIGDLSGDCLTCGFPSGAHATVDQLDDARQKGEARLVVDNPKFRRYIHNGFRFDCRPGYVKDRAPFGCGWAMYARGWRVVSKEIDNWKPKHRVA
jgi:hypothetical protein